MNKWLIPLLMTLSLPSFAAGQMALIDNFENIEAASIGGQWTWNTDQVMGGVSTGTARLINHEGQQAAHIQGHVSTANNGGFIQIRLAFPQILNASAYEGVELSLIGNGAPYYVHLRDQTARRPWHVYRAGYETDGTLQTIRLPFEAFEPYSSRVSGDLDIESLISIGLVAGYDTYKADLKVLSVSFY